MNGVYDPNKGRKLSDEFTPVVKDSLTSAAPDWAHRKVQEAKLALRGKIGSAIVGALLFLAFGYWVLVVSGPGPK